MLQVLQKISELAVAVLCLSKKKCRKSEFLYGFGIIKIGLTLLSCVSHEKI
jgi:hypothetical protein